MVKFPNSERIIDQTLHGAAASIFVAHDRVNYLLQNEILGALIESVGMAVLRRAQGKPVDVLKIQTALENFCAEEKQRQTYQSARGE